MRGRRWRVGGAIPALVGLFGLAALWASGCEGGGTPFCEVRCDCQGCSMREREDCVDDVEDADRIAAHDGCGTEYSEYVACYARGTCEGGVWSAPICDDEGAALKECSSLAGKIVKTLCEGARDKLLSCGFSGVGITTPCTGVAACTARCAIAASCEELQNPQGDGPFAACTTGCQDGGL